MNLLNFLFIALMLTFSPVMAQDAPAPEATESERIAPRLPFDDARPNNPNDLANDAIIIPYEPPPPKDMASLYSPEHCEFSVSFPSDPFIKERCDGGEKSNECYQQVSYTQTFGIAATTGFRVICNKIGSDIKEKYKQDVMVATLTEMTKKSVVSTYNTTFYEDENKRYKVAGLVGEGKAGITPSMFIAQMWIGENSALTIEAELIGEPLAEADAMFRDVLRSVHHKVTKAENDKEAAEKPKEAPKPAP